MQSENRLLTVRETAKLLAVCDRTIFEMTKRGTLPSVRVGNRGVRYSKQALLDWIEKNTVPQ